jgi:hypothetical protein
MAWPNIQWIYPMEVFKAERKSPTIYIFIEISKKACKKKHMRQYGNKEGNLFSNNMVKKIKVEEKEEERQKT